MEDNNDPIVSDSPAPGLSVWLSTALAALKRQPRPDADTPNDPNATVSDAEPRRPAKPGPAAKVETRAAPKAEPPSDPALEPARAALIRSIRKPRPFPFLSSPRPQSSDEAHRDVHGAPALWMAPFFLALALAFVIPFLAAFLTPAAPRATIDGLIHRLPGWARPLSPMMAGWLWAPWYVALPAFLMRLKAAWTTRLAILDAVGWAMSALALEGAAWLLRGRTALGAGGFSPAEQSGCWRLLIIEFVFLLFTATMFGPTRRQWVRFEQ
ncbi:MAG: hypothetical protein JWP35_2278 [Caulobacter sp.]|nr:hypothetical protein [Caulobacter sp.]